MPALPTRYLNAPQYAVHADITVQGASGSDGSASALGTNAGGAGGAGGGFCAGAGASPEVPVVVEGEAAALEAGRYLAHSSAGNNEIAEYPYGATGNVAPSSVITGAATGLAYPLALALDSAGRLYVTNLAAGSITVYAAGATGNAIPIATISGQGTGISGPSGVAVAPPLVIRTHKLAAAHVGRSYRAQLRANLGTTPYRWKVTRGKLPTGLRLRRDGMLSGRPHKRGTYRFTVRVKDASHPTMTATSQLMLQVPKNR